MSKIDNLQDELDDVLGADAVATPPADDVPAEDPGAGEDPAPEPGTVPASDEEPILGETYNGVAVPAKFIGKPVSELVKSYTGLETRLGDPARSNNARQTLKEAGVSEQALDKLGDLDEETIKKIEAMDFTEMKPADFAKAMVGILQTTASRQVQTYMGQQQKVQATVKAEVAEAKTQFPLLASSPEFRQAVLQVVGNAESQGQNVTLVEACEQVHGQLLAINQTMGIKSPEVEARKDKGSQATLEPGTPARTVPVEGDEQAVKSAILNAGNGMSPLGGL